MDKPDPKRPFKPGDRIVCVNDYRFLLRPSTGKTEHVTAGRIYEVEKAYTYSEGRVVLVLDDNATKSRDLIAARFRHLDDPEAWQSKNNPQTGKSVT